MTLWCKFLISPNVRIILEELLTQKYTKNHTFLLKEYPLLKEFFQKVKLPLNQQTANDIYLNLSKLIGKGQGSTPEYDDLFCGLIAYLIVEKEIEDETLLLLVKYPYERQTTLKSSKIIRRILNKNYPTELVNFLELISHELSTDDQITQFRNESKKILSIGASSGYYFLKGTLFGLKLSETYNYNLKTDS